MQDRDLIIWRILNPELFVELASDEDCPNSDFFLSRLFGRVGDEIRNQELDPLTWKTVSLAVDSIHADVSRWAVRSLALRSQPDLFEYDNWRDGRLVRDTQPVAERATSHITMPLSVKWMVRAWLGGPLSVVVGWS